MNTGGRSPSRGLMAMGECGDIFSPNRASAIVTARIKMEILGAADKSLAVEAPLDALESDARIEEGIADVGQQVDDDDQRRPEQHRELQDREIPPGNRLEGQPPQAGP